MSEDKIDELYEKFTDVGLRLGDEVNGELNAGNGIQSKEDRKEFIEYFGGILDSATKALNDIKHIDK